MDILLASVCNSTQCQLYGRSSRSLLIDLPESIHSSISHVESSQSVAVDRWRPASQTRLSSEDTPWVLAWVNAATTASLHASHSWAVCARFKVKVGRDFGPELVSLTLLRVPCMCMRCQTTAHEQRQCCDLHSLPNEAVVKSTSRTSTSHRANEHAARPERALSVSSSPALRQTREPCPTRYGAGRR